MRMDLSKRLHPLRSNHLVIHAKSILNLTSLPYLPINVWNAMTRSQTKAGSIYPRNKWHPEATVGSRLWLGNQTKAICGCRWNLTRCHTKEVHCPIVKKRSSKSGSLTALSGLSMQSIRLSMSTEGNPIPTGFGD